MTHCKCKRVKKAPSAFNLYIKSITKKGESIGQALKESKWKTMTEAQKEPFIKKSMELKKTADSKRRALPKCRCKKEHMELKEGNKRRTRKSPRRPSGYNLYIKSITKKGEGIAQALKESKWKTMSEAQKSVWNNKAKSK